MAKVEINESEVRVEHKQAKEEGEKKGQKSDSTAVPSALDVDTLVDICVERVFEMLKANFDR